MRLVVHPSSITCHQAIGFGYQSISKCGHSCASWPAPADLTPLRFCRNCFSPQERDDLAKAFQQLHHGDAQ